VVVTAAVAVVVAYLVGAVPIGLLVARVFGVADIRQHGSGNIGTTNVLRTMGTGPAVVTLLGDVVKGFVAVAAASAIGRDPHVTAAAAVAAVVGNCWSVFLRFRGGKGVATGLGALLNLVPWATAPAAVVWLAIVASFRYVSLASIAAALCVPLGALLLGYPGSHVLAALIVSVIVVARHRENISRLLAGNERRLGARATS
jgi:glycerol-3-phosphate acyltransferase PlsY